MNFVKRLGSSNSETFVFDVHSPLDIRISYDLSHHSSDRLDSHRLSRYHSEKPIHAIDYVYDRCLLLELKRPVNRKQKRMKNKKRISQNVQR